MVRERSDPVPSEPQALCPCKAGLVASADRPKPHASEGVTPDTAHRLSLRGRERSKVHGQSTPGKRRPRSLPPGTTDRPHRWAGCPPGCHAAAYRTASALAVPADHDGIRDAIGETAGLALAGGMAGTKGSQICRAASPASSCSAWPLCWRRTGMAAGWMGTGERIATNAPTRPVSGRERDEPCPAVRRRDGVAVLRPDGRRRRGARCLRVTPAGRSRDRGPGARSGGDRQGHQPFELADFLAKAAHARAVDRFQPHRGGDHLGAKVGQPRAPVIVLDLQH